METKQIALDVSANNEGTCSPYWMIVDARQMMKPDCHTVASMVTGPFFSREEADDHIDARSHAFSKKAVVFCMSGYWSNKYKTACREAGI